jgi:hypothetical protein
MILKNGQFYDSQEAETNMVWICTGGSSHAYHSNEECYGIKACKGERERISLDEAVSMGRTPCHYCHEEQDEKDPYDPDTYDPLSDPEVRKFTNSKGQIVAEVVYVCSGSGATRYHKFEDCSGLNSCSGDIEELYEPEAEHKGYKACKRCYE